MNIPTLFSYEIKDKCLDTKGKEMEAYIDSQREK